MDLPHAQERWPEIEKALKERGVENPMAISAATQMGIRELVQRIFETMAQLPPETSPVVDIPLYDLPEDEFAFNISQESEGVYRVTGKRIERAAVMTYWDYEEAVYRFQKMLDTLGVTKALRDAGVEEGDTVYIGEHELEWSD